MERNGREVDPAHTRQSRGVTREPRSSSFAQIVNGYLAQTRNRGGRVGNAHSLLLDARGLLALALTEMERAAAQ